MVLAYLINDKQFRLATDRKVIKAGEYQALLDATTVLKETSKEAERLIHAAKENNAAEAERGFEAGRAAGKKEYAETIVRAEAHRAGLMASMENEIIELVQKTIHSIVDEAPAEYFFASTLKRLSKTFRERKFVTLTVSESDFADTRRAVDELVQKLQLPTFIDVVADPGKANKTCLLSSEIGSVDASMEAQIEAISAALQAAVASTLQQAATEDKAGNE